MSRDLAELERQVEDLKPKEEDLDRTADYPAILELAG